MTDEEQKLAEVEALLRAVAAVDRRRAEEHMNSSGERLEHLLCEAMNRPATRGKRLYAVLSAAASLAVMGLAGAVLFYHSGWDSPQAGQNSVPPERIKTIALPDSMPQPCILAAEVGSEETGSGIDCGAGEKSVQENFTVCSGPVKSVEPRALTIRGENSVHQPVKNSPDDRVAARPAGVSSAKLRSCPVAGRGAAARKSEPSLLSAHVAGVLAKEEQPYSALRACFEMPGVDKCVELPDGIRVEYHEGIIRVTNGAQCCELRSPEDTLSAGMRCSINPEKKLEK